MVSIGVGILSTVALIAVLVYAYSLGYWQDTFMDVHYYDGNGNEILMSKGLSIIGGLEGVEYISLEVNIKNTGEVPLEIKIKDASPSQLKSALPTNIITLPIGEDYTWNSDLIDVGPFEGTTQIFTVIVNGEYTYAGKLKALEKEGSISLSIQPDPTGGFDVLVTLDSGSDDPDTPIECTENWVCGEWGTCTNNEQMRDCTDSNDCGTTNEMPAIVQNCVSKTVEFRADDLNYGSGWVMYKGVGYGYSGYSTFSCTDAGATILINVPGGYSACLRSGYDISSRIYIDDGKGRIYKPSDPDALNAVLTGEPTEPYASDGLEIYK